MNQYGYPLVVAVMAIWSLNATAQAKGAGATEHPEDWMSPDSLAAAVYSIVSGPVGEARDWDRYRALFDEDARFTTFGETEEGLQVYTFGVEDYIKFYGPSFVGRGVYEKEVWSRLDRYLHLAQRWGSCEYRWGTSEGPPAGRCQVTMQFVHDGERWWISSMVWESEADAHPISASYLPGKE